MKFCKERAGSKILQNDEFVESVVFKQVKLREQCLPAKMQYALSPGFL